MNTDHVYLTNGSCENAGFVGARWMERIGLEFGESDGFFYPLTEDEARFIGTDQVTIGDSETEAWLAFSILYMDRKWLAPVIEIAYQGSRCTDEAAPNRESAKQTSQKIHEQLAERVDGVGGHAFMHESASRFWIEIALPFELAMEQVDFDGWKAFLEHMLFAGISIKEHPKERQAIHAMPAVSSLAIAA